MNARPVPFAFYTAAELWTDAHTSRQMLRYHLDEQTDIASRRRDFIDRSAAWIIRRFNIDTNTAVADFGCGPGLYTIRLARTGADVTGIDFSGRSIEYAQTAASQNNLAITYCHENYLDFASDKRFDLMLMIMCDYCALSPVQRKQLLHRFHTHLKPGGSILLDAYTRKAFDQKQEQAFYEKNQLNGFWSPNPYYGFVNIFKYETEQVSLDKYTIIEADRTRVVYNWLQYFTPETLSRELTDNGFIMPQFFADAAGTPFDPDAAEMAVIAQKAN